MQPTSLTCKVNLCIILFLFQAIWTVLPTTLIRHSYAILHANSGRYFFRSQRSLCMIHDTFITSWVINMPNVQTQLSGRVWQIVARSIGLICRLWSEPESKWSQYKTNVCLFFRYVQAKHESKPRYGIFNLSKNYTYLLKFISNVFANIADCCITSMTWHCIFFALCFRQLKDTYIRGS